MRSVRAEKKLSHFQAHAFMSNMPELVKSPTENHKPPA